MIAVIWSIIAFLIAISILIAFHEFGHFLVARACGIKVLRFSIGFGKTLWSYQGKKGTEYVIAALPFGGYVKMLDEEEGDAELADLPFAFNRKPVWIRMLVVLAGPFFNVILAVFIYWLIFCIGITTMAPIVGEIHPDSAIAQAGLQEGDEIIAVNHKKTPSWDAVNKALIRNIGSTESVPIQIKTPQDKQTQTYYLDLKAMHLNAKNADLLGHLGLTPYLPPIKPVIARVKEGGAAAQAGLKLGDEITHIDGRAVETWEQLTEALNRHAAQNTVITVTRDNRELRLEVKPQAEKLPDGSTIARLGIESKPVQLPAEMLRKVQYSVISAWVPAIQKTASTISLTFIILYKMVSGYISINTISGPIGIAQGAGYTAQLGFVYYLDFLALISISLAVINILPIPMLDGGHFLYYVIEVIRRKPLSRKAQEIGLRIGLVLLLGLMLYAILNDVNRIFS